MIADESVPFQPSAPADAVGKHARLDRTWSNPLHGVRGWFSDVGHKTIGLRFIVTAGVFFALGGVEAALMRLQLAQPDQQLLGPDLYNQVFTVHGSTMMFLFAVPVFNGLAIYFVPLMVGSRETAFPRLTAYAYYTYVIGGLLLYVSFFLNVGPDAGWFSYVPLAGPDYGAGKRTDVWAQLVTFTELSTLGVAVSVIATILKHRAPGMTIDRVPMFVWAMLVQNVMILLAMPAVMLASSMLAMDRLIGTHFFNYAEGGDVLLWQHLFWFFGHPEVYIIFIPALGILSTLIATFTRRQLFGYHALVLSLVATGFIGFGVWAHHMFATGMSRLTADFFSASSIAIVLPTGVQFFCWIATLWGGTIRLTTPMLYALGFFAVFVVGGVTGVMLGAHALDLQLHDTFFVVAHLHYVLIGGSVFPLLGGVHYWYPKWTGRLLDETLGRWSFALFFLGFNLVFFPMHVLGLQGMPRRVYTYDAARGWGDLNLLATIGAGVLALSLVLLLVNLIRSARRGALAGNNPWDADTLEWATASPPASYSFLELPTVSSRYALWGAAREQPVVTGLKLDRREVLVTRVVDAEPDHRSELPDSTIWPVLAALGTGVTFIVAMFTPWGIVLGGVLTGAAVIGWYWPKAPYRDPMAAEQPRRTRHFVARADQQERAHARELAAGSAPPLDVSALPSSAFGSRDPLWWGIVGLMVIEGTVFALLFASYFYLEDRAAWWPPALSARSAWLAAGGLGLLLLSCVPIQRSTVAAKRGSLEGMRRSLGLGSALGLAFLALRFLELDSLPFRWDTNAYGSVFWVTLGMHTTHGIIGCMENLLLLLLLFRGPVEEKHLVDVAVNGMYWYFIVITDALCVGILDLDPWLFH